MDPLEPISPELALVSPELAAVARAELPDRPWEVFLPAADERIWLRPPAPAVARRTPASAAAPVQTSPSRRRPRVPVSVLLLLAFVGLVTAGSVLPARDEPTLGPRPARASGVPTVESPVREGGPAVSAPPKRSDLNPPPPPSLHQPPITATPSGGYVLGREGGVLRVDAGARMILELRSTVRCGGPLVVRGIRIASDGRFATRRTIRGRHRVTVTVDGAFFGTGKKVRGTIVATRRGCSSGRIRFSGRLS